MLLRHIQGRARPEIPILAEAGATDWTVVAIVASIAVALAGSCVALIISRMNRQSVKHEALVSLLHSSIGKWRERMALTKAKIDDVEKLYDHNIPEQFTRLRKLENWQAGMVVRCDKCEAEAGEDGK